MKFHALEIQDAKLIELDLQKDERGFFARSFCKELLQKEHLPHVILQSSISFNNNAGTLRGLHFQKEPYTEGKFVRCTRGHIYDVIVDLRKNSITYGKWCSVNLVDRQYNILFIPKGCAHGFVTLEDNCEIYYEIDTMYVPDNSAGILWNSPELNITWPIQVPIISEKDKKWPVFSRGQDYL